MEIEQTLRLLKSELGLESFRVRQFAAIQRVVALLMLVYAFLIELLQTGSSLVSTLCQLTRWLGLKKEKPSPYKLKWGISRLLAYHPSGYG